MGNNITLNGYDLGDNVEIIKNNVNKGIKIDNIYVDYLIKDIVCSKSVNRSAETFTLYEYTVRHNKINIYNYISPFIDNSRINLENKNIMKCAAVGADVVILSDLINKGGILNDKNIDRAFKYNNFVDSLAYLIRQNYNINIEKIMSNRLDNSKRLFLICILIEEKKYVKTIEDINIIVLNSSISDFFVQKNDMKTYIMDHTCKKCLKLYYDEFNSWRSGPYCEFCNKQILTEKLINNNS